MDNNKKQGHVNHVDLLSASGTLKLTKKTHLFIDLYWFFSYHQDITDKIKDIIKFFLKIVLSTSSRIIISNTSAMLFAIYLSEIFW